MTIPPDDPVTLVPLTQRQARWLSILAAADLRGDEAHGRNETTSRVIRDIHLPAWQALQPACEWDHDDEPEETG